MSNAAATELSPKQQQAIIALLTEPSVRHAAKAIGVHEATVHRWLAEPGFRRAFREARHLSFMQAMALTQQYAPLAIQTAAKIMTDPGMPAAARVSALAIILKFSRESIELDDIVERVEALERGQGRPEPFLVLPPSMSETPAPAAHGHAQHGDVNGASDSGT